MRTWGREFARAIIDNHGQESEYETYARVPLSDPTFSRALA